MEVFDLNELRKKLKGLPEWKRVAFMAICCERMFQNYRAFNSEADYGDPNTLSRAVASVWDWIRTGNLPDDLSQIIQECDEQAPDTSKFASVYTSAALDAANSISITLEALGGATEDMAIEVASLARDTVDLFVQQKEDLNPNSLDLEREILDAPLMQQELLRQRESLEKLEREAGDRSTVETKVRSWWPPAASSLVLDRAA